jgi:hypothetical protein
METINNIINWFSIEDIPEPEPIIYEEIYKTNQNIMEIIFKNNNKKTKKTIVKKNNKNIEIKPTDNNNKNIWEVIKNTNHKFSKNHLITNLNISTSRLFNKGFLEYISFYKFSKNKNAPNTFITSGNKTGSYSINFSNINIDNHINKVSLTKWCQNSPYYPKSFLLENKSQLNNLPLQPNQMYFLKPAHGEGSKNIGISYGKNIVLRPEIINKTPLIFQQDVSNPRLHNGCKQDERIYVLFIKTNQIKTYVYKKGMVRTSKFPLTEKVSIKSHFTLPCNVGKVSTKELKEAIEVNHIKPLIKDISSRVIPHLTQKLDNNHKAEFWLTGWDIIFDKNNYPWLLEINPTPNQCESYFARTVHYPIYQEILDMIVAMDSNKQLPLKNFIPI